MSLLAEDAAGHNAGGGDSMPEDDHLLRGYEFLMASQQVPEG